jgi:hypothetical protein
MLLNALLRCVLECSESVASSFSLVWGKLMDNVQNFFLLFDCYTSVSTPKALKKPRVHGSHTLVWLKENIVRFNGGFGMFLLTPYHAKLRPEFAQLVACLLWALILVLLIFSLNSSDSGFWEITRTMKAKYGEERNLYIPGWCVTSRTCSSKRNHLATFWAFT